MAAEVRLDALPLALDDDLLPAHEVGDGDVVLDREADRVAERAHAEAGEVERRLAQRLRRHGSRVDARAAEDRLPLDERDAFAEIRRLRRPLLARRTGADDDEVVHFQLPVASGRWPDLATGH